MPRRKSQLSLGGPHRIERQVKRPPGRYLQSVGSELLPQVQVQVMVICS